jgi:hypothetical protein
VLSISGELPTEIRSAGNGNLEVLLYFLKAKQGFTARKIKKDKRIYVYLLTSSGMKFKF